jgi:hypothetical protein
MYQRLFVLSKTGHSSTVPWLFKDVLPRLDLLVAYASASIPLLAVLLVNFLFADVKNYKLIIPYIVAVDVRSVIGIERWIVGSTFESETATKWDNLFASVVMILFLAAVVLAVRVMLFLWKITSQNRASLTGE